jgi:hypothetical protein
MGVVAAGCGGSGNDSTLAKAEYQTRANAICKKAAEEKDKALAAAFAEAEKNGQQGDEAAFAELIKDEGLPPLARMTEELQDLGGPEGEEEEAEAVAAAFEEEVETIEADPEAALGGKGGQFGKANELARELGLKACAAI